VTGFFNNKRDRAAGMRPSEDNNPPSTPACHKSEVLVWYARTLWFVRSCLNRKNFHYLGRWVSAVVLFVNPARLERSPGKKFDVSFEYMVIMEDLEWAFRSRKGNHVDG
jgi:hypothetical protein